VNSTSFDPVTKRPTRINRKAFITTVGIPAEWVPVLRKAGIKLPADLAEANPNKLLHELSGLRKKLKLEIPSLRLEEVSAWCGK
jgi:lysyl-tRNA synthetase class 2